jgi:predicted lipoprotein
VRGIKAIGGAITLACALLAMFAATGPAAAFDDAALAKQAYAGIILPGYARFDDAARAFEQKSAALCKAPSQPSLDATRAASRATLLAWGRIAPIRFGPITYKQRLDRLLFYPDQHGIVGKQTTKLIAKRDDADLDPVKLEGASVAVQGFGAVDVALYGHGTEALATADPEAAFRCRYIHALAADIAQIAADTHADWTGEYKQAWLQPGDGNKAFLTAKETTLALFSAYVTEIEVVRLQRLAPAMGAESAKASSPLLPHSGLGLPYLISVVEGARDLVGTSGFLADDLATTDKERAALAIVGSVATDLGFAVRAGEAAVAMAPDPLQDAAARERLGPMLLSLESAEATGRAALGDLTGQTIGFNSLDGD